MSILKSIADVLELYAKYPNLGDESKVPVLKHKKTGEQIVSVADAIKAKVNLADYEAVEVEPTFKADIITAITGSKDGSVTVDDINNVDYLKDLLVELAGKAEFNRVKRNLMQNRSKARKDGDKAKELDIEAKMEDLYEMFGETYKPKEK